MKVKSGCHLPFNVCILYHLALFRFISSDGIMYDALTHLSQRCYIFSAQLLISHAKLKLIISHTVHIYCRLLFWFVLWDLMRFGIKFFRNILQFICLCFTNVSPKKTFVGPIFGKLFECFRLFFPDSDWLNRRIQGHCYRLRVPSALHPRWGHQFAQNYWVYWVRWRFTKTACQSKSYT